MSTIAANQPINRYRHRLCLIVLAAALWLDTWAALVDANAVHIELRRRRSVRFNGIEVIAAIRIANL